jgi:hypothetical protein
MGNVDIQILTFLGSSFYQRHHVKKACQYLLSAAVQSSLPADWQAPLIQALIQTQQWPQAREQLIVYLESFGMDPRVRELIALLANNPNRPILTPAS